MGEMLRRWGEGASLVRGDWRPREPAEEDGSSDEDDAMEDDDSESTHLTQKESMNGRQAPPHMHPTASTSALRPLPAAQPPRPKSASVGPSASARPPVPLSKSVASSSSSIPTALDALADTMSSLSLVPSSIRFGRGAKSSGHTGRHNHSVSFASPVAQTHALPPHSSFASAFTPTASQSSPKEQAPAKEPPALGSGLASLKLSPALAAQNGSTRDGKTGVTAPTGRSTAARASGQSGMAVDSISPTSPTSPASRSQTSSHTNGTTVSNQHPRGHGSRGGLMPRGGFGPRGRGFGPRGRGRVLRGGRGRGG